MGAYEYEALDAGGRTRRGVATGDTPRQVRQKLRDDGFIPLAVVAVGEEKPGAQLPWSRTRRISASELAVITRQFATLVSAGLTIEEALHALVQQSESHQVKTILSGIRALVLEGRSLGDAVAAFPRAFPGIYHATIDAGEQAGRLDVVLERLADFTETRQAVRQRVGLALIYPVILTVVAILIVTGLLTYVVPEVVKVFQDVGQQLPLLTRALIGLAAFLKGYGLWLLLAGALLGTGLTLMFRQPRPRLELHRFLLRLPLVRRLVRGMNTARMARTLAIMAGSGVPLLSAMSAAAEVTRNLVLRAALHAAREEVREGVSLAKALARCGEFPPILVQMVASGEASGQLDKMLDKAALTQERELETRIAVLVGLFEPLMILLMGAVVLIIVLAILLPIFDLNQLVR